MSTRPLFVLGFVSFALIGALQATYGPAFAGQPNVGVIASLHFLGSMIGLAVAGALLTRLGLRGLLYVGAAVLALGTLAVALAPTPALLLAGALTGGLGFGAFSVAFNVGFSRLPTGAPAALNLGNAFFGLGSIMAPLLVVAGGQVGPFVVFALIGAALLLAARRLPELPERVQTGPARAPLAPVLGFGLLLFTYVGIEAGVGTWITTHLSAVGGGDERARQIAMWWTTGFWATVTLGRVLAAPLSARVPLPALVAACALIAGLGLLLTATPYAAFAYLLVGLAIAPIFGSTIGWFSDLLPTRLTPVILVCGGLGGTLFPALLGEVVRTWGLGALPYAFTLIAVATAAVTGGLWAALRPQAEVRGREERC